MGKHVLSRGYTYRKGINESHARNWSSQDSSLSPHLTKSSTEHSQPALPPQAKVQRLFAKGMKINGGQKSDAPGEYPFPRPLSPE